MTPLHVALLALIQVAFEIVAPVIAWSYLPLALLCWLTGRQRTIAVYRVWRKAKGTAPKLKEGQNIQQYDPTQEMESDVVSYLPYSIAASRREFFIKAGFSLFILVSSVMLSLMPGGAGGAWLLLWGFLVFGVEQSVFAYRFWQREKRIALDNSPDPKLA